MKKNKFYYSLIFLILGISACNNVNPKEKLCLTINKSKKAEYVYFGLSNYFTINVKGCDNDEIIVRTKYASIQNVLGSSYKLFIMPKQNNDISLDTIKVFVKKGNEMQLAGYKVIQYIHIPPPTQIKVGKFIGGAIKKTSLLNQNQLNSSFGEYSKFFNFDFKVPVASFIVSATIDGIIYEAKSESNMITEKQKVILSKLKTGDKVYFENILVALPYGKKEISPVMFKVIGE